MKHTISIFRFALVMLAALITLIFISLSAFADSGNVNTIEFTYAGAPTTLTKSLSCSLFVCGKL